VGFRAGGKVFIPAKPNFIRKVFCEGEKMVHSDKRSKPPWAPDPMLVSVVRRVIKGRPDGFRAMLRPVKKKDPLGVSFKSKGRRRPL